jgi:hypothetical protein
VKVVHYCTASALLFGCADRRKRFLANFILFGINEQTPGHSSKELIVFTMLFLGLDVHFNILNCLFRIILFGIDEITSGHSDLKVVHYCTASALLFGCVDRKIRFWLILY